MDDFSCQEFSPKRQTSNKNVGKQTVISELFWQTTIILAESGCRLREKRGLFTTAVVIDPDGCNRPRLPLLLLLRTETPVGPKHERNRKW